MKKQIMRKIDPMILDDVHVGSQNTYRVILFASQYEACKKKLMEYGVIIWQELPFIDAYCVEVPAAALDFLAHQKEVRYIASDVETTTQMHIASSVVRANTLHQRGITGKGIRIAVIDTGISLHPDFLRPRNRIAAFVDVVNHRLKPYDDNGHGSFVAGVAAGNGYLSQGKYTGIAPEAELVVIKAMNEEGGGNSSDVLYAMQWISDNREKLNIRIASLSLGLEAGTIRRDDALVRGVEALWDQGITVVVAAGNSGPLTRTITVPGTSSKVITVGASDDKRTLIVQDDTIADFSGRGPTRIGSKPDLVAPGVDIVSVKSDIMHPYRNVRDGLPDGYTHMSGTSVSTPIVSGAVALLLQQYPHLKPDEVKMVLRKQAISLIHDPNAEGSGVLQL